MEFEVVTIGAYIIPNNAMKKILEIYKDNAPSDDEEACDCRKGDKVCIDCLISIAQDLKIGTYFVEDVDRMRYTDEEQFTESEILDICKKVN